jgi:hypothetical protein
MKRLIPLILAFLLGAPAAFAQYAGMPEADRYRGDNRYAHLEYFGFYASAMAHWNFTAELAPFTNLTWVHFGSPDNPDAALDGILGRLAEARQAGVGAVLSIEPFLFLDAAGEIRPEEEIEDFLVELRARLELEGLIDTLVMIYPKDEPFREFVRHRDPPFHEQYITGEVYAEIHADLLYVNSLIKLAFPDKPIGVILSGHNLTHRFFSIPENYDWVGFDCYDNLFRGCDNRSFVQLYHRLREHMQPQQRLIAVPETWALTAQTNRADWPEVLARRLDHHYEIALNDPRFIAVIPFIWSFDAEGDTPGLGLNRFPELYDDGVTELGTTYVEQVRDIGRQVKHGETRFPNLHWAETEETQHRPPSNILGEIMGIGSNGMVSAWAIDTALPHKNLRVQVLLRDEQGELIYKSRPERTFIADPSLEGPLRIGQKTTGLKGFRHQLPPAVLWPRQGQNLQVELLTYADGRDMAPGHIHSSWFMPGRSVSSPLSDLPKPIRIWRPRR